MDHVSDSAVQKQLDAAMPWVGLYIAAASAICTLAMAVDAVNCLRQKKLWFPCKYTSLNAASLTLLAVAMKLPVDLNTVMFKSRTDSTAKFMSLHFMSVIVTNLIPSLASMTDKEVLANVVGLGILVITITGNVGIQIIELRSFLQLGTVKVAIPIPYSMATIALMTLSFLLLLSLAVTVATMKRNLNYIYEEKIKAMAMEEEGVDVDDERERMMKYWVMSESCSPQFVMARSVVCTASAFICWSSFMVLFLAQRIHRTRLSLDAPGESTYGIYTKFIVYIQTIGIGIGVIVAMLRWFRIVMFRCATNYSRNEFKIEAYWIRTLKDWRNSFGCLQIRPNRLRKYLHRVKCCVLTLCIGIQIFIVLLSKMLVLFSVFIVHPILYCFSHINRLVKQTDETSTGDNERDRDRNLNRYVLLLDGETELPPSFVESMCAEAHSYIQKGRRKKPLSLLNLLGKSVNFNGVGEFNSSDIPSLLSQDPPHCWTLAVVTLTCIAMALPNTALHKRKQLLSSVGEGLSLASIIENTFERSAQLKYIQEVARVTWIDVLFYFKWLGMDLNRAFVNFQSTDEVLQELSRKAEGIVVEFNREVKDPIMEKPENLPVRVVAANSMYRICRSISVGEINEETSEELLERLSVMIADILGACLTNMPYAIRKMCHQKSIEKRERSVREALILVGKTEQVTEVVRRNQRPSMDHHKAAYIEEWRPFLRKDKDGEAASASASNSSDEHLDIILD